MITNSSKITILTISIGYSIFAFSNNVFAGDNYPKTLQERQMDDMGSIVGGEGLVFRPGKVKNESTLAQVGTVNKYLWQATIETLHFAPLASADSNGGVVITEWHSPKGKPNFRFKINIFIKDNIISPNAIEVKVFEQILKSGQWIDNDNKSDLAFTIEDTILRKARTLYINAERSESVK